MRIRLTATTAREAEDLLGAAMDQIGSHLQMIHPGDASARGNAGRSLPVALTLDLDLTALTQAAQQRHTA